MPAIIRGNSGQGTNVHITQDEDYKYPDSMDLRPGSQLSTLILNEVLTRANESQEAMSHRYPSWQSMDKVLTAYIPLDEEEKQVKSDDDRKPVSVIFPYTYAIKETLTTYTMAALVQDPIFQYDGVGPEDTPGAIMLEAKINQDCFKSKVALNLHTMFSDSFSYGMGIVTPGWDIRRGMRSGGKVPGTLNKLSKFLGFGNVSPSKTNSILYEGNKLSNIDPYLALPDPSVSSSDVQKGDYYGWIDETSYINLLQDEGNSDGEIFNVKYLRQMSTMRTSVTSDNQKRDYRDKDKAGTSKYGDISSVVDLADVIYMYVNLIPREWKLGDGEYPEKWLFGIAGDSIVVQAKPLGLLHGMYPVATASPDYDGYSMAPLSRLEMLQGLQTTIDWLFNSHIANVRKAINDMFIVDPYMLNMKDLRDPKPGKLIRTRRSAWGKGVRDYIHQLSVNDITRNNIGDVSWIVNWMNNVVGVDESMMGSLRQGGPERLTGTEFSGTRKSALSRLNKMANVMSLQAMQDIAYFFAAHTQQLMSQEVYAKSTGRLSVDIKKEYGLDPQMNISPSSLDIDYDIIGRDGSIPGNQSMDAWLRIFDTVLSNPEANAEFDSPRILSHMARELGAKNVEDFKRKVTIMPDDEVEQELDKGNLRPV